jgi:predicted NBD/HSP70 family sugar kinase
VTAARFPGWVERFDQRHPGAEWRVTSDVVEVRATDGAWAQGKIPFGPAGDLSLAGLFTHLATSRRLGVLLVRRGGFAVAHAQGQQLVAVKVGRRHVQGRTKAGGWSQQRFARRRDNQARQAFDAAADHAVQILAPVADSLDLFVIGGDRAAVEHVLSDRRLTRLDDVPRHWVPVSTDPRREALESAVANALSIELDVVDPTWQ